MSQTRFISANANCASSSASSFAFMCAWISYSSVWPRRHHYNFFTKYLRCEVPTNQCNYKTIENRKGMWMYHHHIFISSFARFFIIAHIQSGQWVHSGFFCTLALCFFFSMQPDFCSISLLSSADTYFGRNIGIHFAKNTSVFFITFYFLMVMQIF